RHVALVAAPDDGGRTFLDDAEQDVVGMVPRVAAGIVRWRWKTPGWKRGLPVRLPLELRAVAGRTLVRIDLPALFDDFCRCRGGGRGTDLMPSDEDRQDQAAEEQSEPQDITEFFSHELHDWLRGISMAYMPRMSLARRATL